MAGASVGAALHVVTSMLYIPELLINSLVAGLNVHVIVYQLNSWTEISENYRSASIGVGIGAAWLPNHIHPIGMAHQQTYQ